MRNLFSRLNGRRSEIGANLVEYSLLVAFIALICIGAMGFIGSATQKPMNIVGSSLNSAS
jgi:Flp pilus assembly pilin Flp